MFERNTSGPAVPPKPTSASSHGFPAVQHRSKSAFARSREDAQKPKSMSITRETRPQVPSVVTSARLNGEKSEKPTPVNWRAQMSKENEARVANMTDEEREAEKREILERFGAGIGDILKRARGTQEPGAVKDRWSTQKPRTPPPASDDGSEGSLKDLLEGG